MKRSAHSHLPFNTLTDPGLTRGHNEDRFAITAFAAENELVPESLLCVLCDGVGGHQAGETAAEIAVDKITSFIEECDGTSPPFQLCSAIQSASNQVYRAALTSENLYGMASTTACAWVIGQRLFTATVGDSRIYLLSHGYIQQISTDHTWLQEALEAGVIGPADFQGHPNAHMIRRFIGSETPPEVDIRLKIAEVPEQNHQGMLLEHGDIVFLCSDGISDLINENEIFEIFENRSLEASLEELKQVAYQRGAYDNLTMIAVEIPSQKPPVAPRVKRLRLLVFGIIVLVAALTGIILAWLTL
ncbi:MAG: putative protein phosphatase [Chloroflexi bacterium]|nr:MAG: putative protein phosphatase [Chloroflexota bacterium]MBA4374919.1 hypothetical protein [Anaerolinea sp.]